MKLSDMWYNLKTRVDILPPHKCGGSMSSNTTLQELNDTGIGRELCLWKMIFFENFLSLSLR